MDVRAAHFFASPLPERLLCFSPAILQSRRCTMDRRDRELPRQSSLPSSLIPHLYSGPQQPRESSTRTTLEDDVVPQSRSVPFHLNPVPQRYPLRAPLSSAPLSDHRRLSDSYERLDIGDSQPSSSRLPQVSSTSMHRALPPPSASSPTRFTRPIYSDPVFHSSSRPAMSSRAQSYTLPPLPSPREFMIQRTSWREGEPGPSSLMQPATRSQEVGRHRRDSGFTSRASPRLDEYSRGHIGYEREASSTEPRRRERERDEHSNSGSGSLFHSGFLHSLSSFEKV